MEDAKSVVRTSMECWNARDRDGFARCYDEEVSYLDVAKSQDLQGREQLVEGTYDPMIEAYPDGEFRDVLIFGEGDLVCVRGRFTGTHTGIFRGAGMELPATGKRVDWEFAWVGEVHADKVTNARFFHDLLTPLTQQGLVDREKLLTQLVV